MWAQGQRPHRASKRGRDANGGQRERAELTELAAFCREAPAVFEKERLVIADAPSMLGSWRFLLAFRLLNAWLLRTSFTPDEYWQGPEVAHA